jgi:hypothetical protein
MIKILWYVFGICEVIFLKDGEGHGNADGVGGFL